MKISDGIKKVGEVYSLEERRQLNEREAERKRNQEMARMDYITKTVEELKRRLEEEIKKNKKR